MQCPTYILFWLVWLRHMNILAINGIAFHAPARKFVVYPGVERYRLAADIEAISLDDMASGLVAT
jgi:hypothetical protein